MRRILVGSVLHQERQAQYYLLAESLEEGMEVYGVGVEYGGEAAEIPNITPSQQRIQQLEEVLVRGVVTPATLRDVAEDWLLM